MADVGFWCAPRAVAAGGLTLRTSRFGGPVDYVEYVRAHDHLIAAHKHRLSRSGRGFDETFVAATILEGRHLTVDHYPMALCRNPNSAQLGGRWVSVQHVCCASSVAELVRSGGVLLDFCTSDQ
jgi:hypothetical protein